MLLIFQITLKTTKILFFAGHIVYMLDVTFDLSLLCNIFDF